MNKLMTPKTVDKFAYTNVNFISGKIKGIVLSFRGLGGAKMLDDETPEIIDNAKLYGERGILFVIPYANPWAWMNAQAVKYTDELVENVIALHGLDSTVPVIASGGSMGGQQAIVYTMYASKTPKACVVNCPVCDMPYHFTERPDLPRTMYSAYFEEEGDIEDILKTRSPLHLADKLPRVPYYLFHCNQDKAVNIDMHSEKFVSAMRAAGHDIKYHIVSDRGHCQLDDEAKALFADYVTKEIEK